MIRSAPRSTLLFLFIATMAAAAPAPVPYTIKLDVVTEGMNGDKCWFHPRAGAIPGASPTVVLTMQQWNTKRSEIGRAHV